MSHGTVDRYLGLLLRSLLPEAEPVKYSLHSSRVGFASAPLAAGCPPTTDHPGLCPLELLQRTDSITTRRLPPLPILDEFDIVASFATAARTIARIERRQGAKGYLP